MKLSEIASSITSAACLLIGLTLLSSSVLAVGSVAPQADNFNATTALIDNDGNLWMWGDCRDQKIPGASCANGYISTPFKVGTNYRSIALGEGYTLALKNDDSLWSWGGNSEYGELGDGKLTPRFTPAQIGTGFVAISAKQHALALKADGTLWAWGRNNWGQLGDGSLQQRNIPTLIGDGYQAIAAGGDHSIALKKDGSLWAWGCCNFETGDISTNIMAANKTPVQIGSGYSAIATNVLLKSDGSLWTYGYNIAGELGNGSDDCLGSGSLWGCRGQETPFRPWPRQIGSGFSAISPAFAQAPAALKEDGSLWKWGIHDESTIFTKPVPVGGGYVYVGPKIAIKRDGSVWAWGDNSYGQLGDGSTTPSYFPKAVIAADGKSAFSVKTAAPGVAEASFSATVEKPLTKLRLTVNIKAGSADQGKSASLFVAANADGTWYCLSKLKGWQTCRGDLSAYDSVTLGSHEITLFQGVDMTAFSGTDIYVGYGGSAAEMLGNGSWSMVSRVK